MMRRRAAAFGIFLAFACTPQTQSVRRPTTTPTVAGSTTASPQPPRLVLVGHEPLYARGMNAGLALRFPYAYVGDRTDPSGGKTHPGVLVVDVSRPAAPAVVGAIGPPVPDGTSARELRIWPEQDLLIVLNMRCGASAHACSGPGSSSFRFYDIRGPNARAPRLLLDHRVAFDPHEMFLWIDRGRAGRALLYVSTDVQGTNAVGLVALDISRARARIVREAARWSGNRELGGSLHSVGVSDDGRRAYVAHLAGGFAVLDIAALARARDASDPRLLTPPSAALRWSPGPHSAVPVPGTSLVLTTDEVYGGSAACPWGWARLIDAVDPERPRFAGELRTAHNEPGACVARPRSTRYSFSSHNPTIAAGHAFVSWHGAGLIAAALDGRRLTEAASFVPSPLPSVETEDPRLTAGPVKVAMWSTPIVSNGLLFVVDLRNGLYVLRYEGPGSDAISTQSFAEGNSNVGR